MANQCRVKRRCDLLSIFAINAREYVFKFFKYLLGLKFKYFVEARAANQNICLLYTSRCV